MVERQPWHLLSAKLEAECKWKDDGAVQWSELRADAGDESEDLFMQIKALFRKEGKGGAGLKSSQLSRVVLVRNARLQQGFDVCVRTKEERRLNAASPFHQAFQQDEPAKKALLGRLKERFVALRELTRANIVRAWHGCSEASALAICQVGCADLRKSDGGWFGAGVYATLESEYAAKYSTGQIDELIPPNAKGEHVMLLCLVVVSLVYPLTACDHGAASPRSDFHCGDDNARVDKALKAGFDAHFVEVAPPSYLWTEDGVYTELVLKDESQVLPLALVYFNK
jgi:hypothetical protein